MVSSHGEKSRVMEAVNIGVHEFLVKPVSGNALLTRIVGVVTRPRPMVRRGNYYGPEPRQNHAPSAPPNIMIFLD